MGPNSTIVDAPRTAMRQNLLWPSVVHVSDADEPPPPPVAHEIGQAATRAALRRLQTLVAIDHSADADSQDAVASSTDEQKAAQ
jgi:hypothetical protein